MSKVNDDELADLLSEFFFFQGSSLTRNELLSRIEDISNQSDLILIDQDLRDPLWWVVPQIAMHRFGLAFFQTLEPHHKLDRSFVFIPPAHQHIVALLKESLNQCWGVGEEITLPLTPKLINSLYGGYKWHAAYAAGCQYRGDINLPGTILLLPSCNHSALRQLICYKNAKRTFLSEKVIINRELIDQEMDAIIQAFHCPDVLENSRQLMSLGLINVSEISEISE